MNYHSACYSNSPDHPIRSHQHVRRDREADLFGGFQICIELKLDWPLDWKISRLRATQDFIDVNCGVPISHATVHSVGHQTAIFYEFPVRINGRQLVTRS